VLGVVAALLYERSGSIWPAVTAHVVNNAIVFMVAAIFL
jgi:membrane protease YdiL (CAAX protease family)